MASTTGHIVYTFKESPYSSHGLLLKYFANPKHGERVLDVGCGNGYIAGAISSRGYRVTGIEQAGGHFEDFPEDVSLVEWDLQRGLPPLEGSFDHVLCADVLEHVARPERLLEDIGRVLAPSGRLVASLPNSGNIYFRLQVALGRFPHEEKGLFDRTHLRFYVWSGWKDLLERSGFEIESVQPTGIPVGLALSPEVSRSSWVRWSEALCYQLARMRQTLFGYQFVVVAKRRA